MATLETRLSASRNYIFTVDTNIGTLRTLNFKLYKEKTDELDAINRHGLYDECVERIHRAYTDTNNFADYTARLGESIITLTNLVLTNQKIDVNLLLATNDVIKKFKLNAELIPNIINTINNKQFYPFGNVGSDVQTCIDKVTHSLEKMSKIRPIQVKSNMYDSPPGGSEVKQETSIAATGGGIIQEGPTPNKPPTPTPVKRKPDIQDDADTKRQAFDSKTPEIETIAEIVGQSLKQQSVLLTEKFNNLLKTYLEDTKGIFHSMSETIAQKNEANGDVDMLYKVIQDLNSTITRMNKTNSELVTSISNIQYNTMGADYDVMLQAIDEQKGSIKSLGQSLINEINKQVEGITEIYQQTENTNEAIQLQIQNNMLTVNQHIADLDNSMKRVNLFWATYYNFFIGLTHIEYNIIASEINKNLFVNIPHTDLFQRIYDVLIHQLGDDSQIKLADVTPQTIELYEQAPDKQYLVKIQDKVYVNLAKFTLK